MASTPKGSAGKSSPQSTTAMRSSDSSARQFMPISPRPPSAAMRTGEAIGLNLPGLGAGDPGAPGRCGHAPATPSSTP